jgi:hypothetical protein
MKKYRLLKLMMLTVFGAVCLGSASNALADAADTKCQDSNYPNLRMRRVIYYQDFNPAAGDKRASLIGERSIVSLQGWLYYKNGEANQKKPVVIYNHGHNRERGEPCAIAKYFVSKGFIVFAPLRRGHVTDTGSEPSTAWIQSTGVHIDDYVSQCQRDGNCGCYLHGVWYEHCELRTYIELGYLRDQVPDVREAAHFIKDHASIDASGRNDSSGKLADPDRITILGHSYGGALTVFANSELQAQNAAIDVSGAELSWGNDDEPAWSTELRTAMHNQQRPIYMLQPKNGRYLDPSRVLFGIAVNEKFRSRAEIFPPAPCDAYPDPCDTSVDPEWKQAHENFIGLLSQVKDVWGPSAIEFMSQYPKQ